MTLPYIQALNLTLENGCQMINNAKKWGITTNGKCFSSKQQY